MQRSSLFRVFATIMSVWLAVCLAEPMQLHTCVMHGGLAIELGGHHSATPVTSEHAAMPGHGDQMASHAVADHGQHRQTDHQSRQCSCLGDCSSGKTPTGLVPTAPQLSLPLASSVSAAYEYTSPSLVDPHFLLPFSNGPPAPSSRA